MMNKRKSAVLPHANRMICSRVVACDQQRASNMVDACVGKMHYEKKIMCVVRGRSVTSEKRSESLQVTREDSTLETRMEHFAGQHFERKSFLQIHKKAQLSIFVIIGIIILAAVSAGIYFYQQSSQIKQNSPLELSPVKNYVDQCIDQVAIPGIYLLGLQGGQIFVDREYLNVSDLNVVYGYYKNRNVLISKEEMQQQISAYMELQLPVCLSNFESLKEKGLNVTTRNITANTIIADDEVVININYPVTIKQQGQSQKIDLFSRKYAIRLGHIRNVADKVIKKQQEDPYNVDLTFISGFDVSVDTSLYDADNFLYKITDPLSKQKNQPYVFEFGVKAVKLYPPKLTLDKIYYLKDDSRFTTKLKVESSDTNLSFRTNTAMFDIQKDGTIDFTPRVTGTFNVTIHVEDSHYQYDEKSALFVIEEN